MLKRIFPALILCALSVLSMLSAGVVQAGEPPVLFAVMVGNNQYVGDPGQNLSHADDDVLRLVSTLLSQLGGARIRVLANPDEETRGKYRLEGETLNGLPLAAPVAEPTWDALLRAMDDMQREAEALLKSGRQVVILFYFAGHHTIGGELHLENKTIPGNELEMLLRWTNNRKGVLRLDWRDACTSVTSVSVQKIGRNTQVVGTEEKVTEYEKLKGSILTSLLVTGLSGAAARPGEGYVTVRGLAQWLDEQLSPHLKMRIEGPNALASPNGDEPWVLLDSQGMMVPPSFPPGTLQLWRENNTQSPRLEHTWQHRRNIPDRIKLESGTYRLVQLLTYDVFGSELLKESWSGGRQVLLNSTGLTPTRYFTLTVGKTTSEAGASSPRDWVKPTGNGTLALLSPASRGEVGTLREQLKALEKDIPGISSLELMAVEQSQEVMLEPEVFSDSLSPRAHLGLSDSLTLNLYGEPDWSGPEAGSIWLCRSGSTGTECGLNAGFSREIPMLYYDRLALNLRVGLRYEGSQVKLPENATYTFYARQGLGLGAGAVGRIRIGRLLLGLEESLWWQPTTLWARQQALLQYETPGLILRGSFETALSLKLRLGPLLQVGPRMSLVMPLDLSQLSGSTSDSEWYPESYTESQPHGQLGVEFTLMSR